MISNKKMTTDEYNLGYAQCKKDIINRINSREEQFAREYNNDDPRFKAAYILALEYVKEEMLK